MVLGGYVANFQFPIFKCQSSILKLHVFLLVQYSTSILKHETHNEHRTLISVNWKLTNKLYKLTTPIMVVYGSGWVRDHFLFLFYLFCYFQVSSLMLKIGILKVEDWKLKVGNINALNHTHRLLSFSFLLLFSCSCSSFKFTRSMFNVHLFIAIVGQLTIEQLKSEKKHITNQSFCMIMDGDVVTLYFSNIRISIKSSISSLMIFNLQHQRWNVKNEIGHVTTQNHYAVCVMLLSFDSQFPVLQISNQCSIFEFQLNTWKLNIETQQDKECA